MGRLLLLAILSVGCSGGSNTAPDSGTGTDAGGGGGDAGSDAGGRDAGAHDAGPLRDAGPGLPVCSACSEHAECGPHSYCATTTAGERACVPACNPDLPMCPRGFRCLLDVGAGVPESTCLPVGERCCVDEDGDGHGEGIGCDGTDCDDADPAVHAGAAERCDAAMRDEDCDGMANEDCECVDDETRPCTLPGACAAGTETCVAGTWGACSVPPAEETCNGADDDCDGTIDEAVERTFYFDADGDGDGDPGISVVACTPPAGYVASRGDCDDANPAVSSRAAESCGCPLLDENCNGLIDEGCGCSCGATRPCGVSGVGECRLGIQTCDGTWGACMGWIGPTTETCNGRDDDCDGTTDNPPAAASCPIAGSACTGGACACPAGSVICADGSRCIAAGACCTDADCADGLCEAGRCRPGIGCAAGRRRGFLDETTWPNVAACGSLLGYPEAVAAAPTVCAAGWHACTATETSALAGPAPTFSPPGTYAWVSHVDATTTWWSEHSDTTCGTATVYANLRGTSPCTNSGVFPEGWRLAIGAGSWGLSHQTAVGCITHTFHACGYPGGVVPVFTAYTLCCR